MPDGAAEAQAIHHRPEFRSRTEELEALPAGTVAAIGARSDGFFVLEVGTIERCVYASEVASEVNAAGFGYHGRPFGAEDVVVVLHWLRRREGGGCG